ncbi:MAG TPA: hypothetical protein VMT10_02540 [Solirubrobacteraceae bacterium]|nr:hypothetical protein [Solirubrobacteraceae bacterium]
MPLVVVDTSISLPATLSPTGLTRKFWVLLAYGALAYREEHLRLELDAIEAEAGDDGAIGGRDAIESLIGVAARRRAALAELLPPDAPAGWVAAGSGYLFDEYERKAIDVGPRLGRAIDREEAARLRRQLQAICVAGPEPFAPTDAPALTRDPADDPIVYTALRVGADLLISDDRDIVPDRDAGTQPYQHADSSILAITFGQLVDEHLHDVDWSAIHGDLLFEAHRQLPD